MGELWCRDCGDGDEIKPGSMLCRSCAQSAQILGAVMSFNIAVPPGGHTVTVSPEDVTLSYSSFGTWSVVP